MARVRETDVGSVVDHGTLQPTAVSRGVRSRPDRWIGLVIVTAPTLLGLLIAALAPAAARDLGAPGTKSVGTSKGSSRKSAPAAGAKNQAEPSQPESAAALESFWLLLHERQLPALIQLSQDQRSRFRQLFDDLDLRFFPLRNQSADKALAGMRTLITEARQALPSILDASQTQQLDQLRWWRRGIEGFRDAELQSALALSQNQQQDMIRLLDQSQQDLKEHTQRRPQPKAAATRGKPDRAYELWEHEARQLQLKGQQDVLAKLNSMQRVRYRELAGATPDESLLGDLAFRIPDFQPGDGWYLPAGVEQPGDLKSLRGQVLAIHFYAFGCINCIHNYPVYADWTERLAGRNFQMIGIQTPETEEERVAARVKQKAAEEKFAFPVLIDGQSRNWAAWGNSMWPCVYIVDKRGYLRTFWAGELKWEGATGDQQLLAKIEALLKEPDNEPTAK